MSIELKVFKWVKPICRIAKFNVQQPLHQHQHHTVTKYSKMSFSSTCHAATNTKQEQLTTFTWSRDGDKASSSSSTVNYTVKPQAILDLFAKFDPNLIVTEFSCESATKSGDNYLTEVHRVDVKAVKSQESAGALNPFNKTYNLILKTLPANPALLGFINYLGTFVKESLMYGMVLPELIRFQKQVGIVARDLWLDYPLYYGSMVDGKGDYLALENLTNSGYIGVNRRLGLDKAHSSLVLQSLGKYHAISYARFRGDFSTMLKEYPNLVERLWPAPGIPGSETSLVWLGKSVKIMIDELRAAGYKHEAEIQILKHSDFAPSKLCQHVHDLVTKSVPHAVIGHGDLWTNNILFKYMDGRPEEPVGLKLIDWQISRVCSRVIDLGYFLLPNTDAGMDPKAEEEYLKIYYDAFANHATKLGYFNPEELTFTQLQTEYDEFRLCGFVTMLALFPAVYGDEKKPIDQDEMFGGTGKSETLGTVLKLDNKLDGILDSKALERLSKIIAYQLPKIRPKFQITN